MNTTTKFPTPPWDMEIAAERLKMEEAAWNSHDGEAVVAGYAATIEMRDGLTFISGREALAAFVRQRMAERLDLRVSYSLWGALKSRMAVRFEAEWRDDSGKWFRSYGVEVFQFTEAGLIEQCYVSQEVEPIPVGK